MERVSQSHEIEFKGKKGISPHSLVSATENMESKVDNDQELLHTMSPIVVDRYTRIVDCASLVSLSHNLVQL